MGRRRRIRFIFTPRVSYDEPEILLKQFGRFVSRSLTGKNQHHRHLGIGLMTPDQSHYSQANDFPDDHPIAYPDPATAAVES